LHGNLSQASRSRAVGKDNRVRILPASIANPADIKALEDPGVIDDTATTYGEMLVICVAPRERDGESACARVEYDAAHLYNKVSGPVERNKSLVGHGESRDVRWAVRNGLRGPVGRREPGIAQRIGFPRGAAGIARLRT